MDRPQGVGHSRRPPSRPDSHKRWTDRRGRSAGPSYEQENGGTAYVSQTGPDSYNLIVESENGQVVTAHAGMNLDDLSGLARNYGWTGWP
jgi:hypothetical protein